MFENLNLPQEAPTSWDRFVAFAIPTILFGSLLGLATFLIVSALLPLEITFLEMWIVGLVVVALPPHLKPAKSLADFLVRRLILSIVTTLFFAFALVIFGGWAWLTANIMSLWFAILLGGASVYFCDLGWQWLRTKLL